MGETRGVIADAWRPGDESQGFPAIITVERTDEDEVGIHVHWPEFAEKVGLFLHRDDVQRLEGRLAAARRA